MDHTATARLQFLASISQVGDPCEPHATGLAVYEERPDEDLFELVLLGTQEALAVLFRRHARRIRSIGLRILRDAAEADDLVQEVFLYLHRKGTLYNRAKGPARSWLIQVAYTQALLRRRELKCHGFYAPPVTDRRAEADSPLVRGTDYDHSLQAFFGRDGWENIWNRLTEYQRETLRLHFYEGCTFAEIAEKLGQSYVNIRHHNYRGLEKFRKHANENGLNWP